MRIKGACISDPNTFITCAGERMKAVYVPSVSSSGVLDVKKDTEFDWQEFIDSFREQTDMAWILNQLQLGNPAVLQSQIGFYGDFTEFPTTYAEILQLNIDAHNMFDRLDPDIRKQYGNDFNQWFSDFGSESWIKNMKGPDVEIIEGPVDQIVKEVTD